MRDTTKDAEYLLARPTEAEVRDVLQRMRRDGHVNRNVLYDAWRATQDGRTSVPLTRLGLRYLESATLGVTYKRFAELHGISIEQIAAARKRLRGLRTDGTDPTEAP